MLMGVGFCLFGFHCASFVFYLISEFLTVPSCFLLWYAGVTRKFEECLVFLSPCLGYDSLINCNASLFSKFVLDQGVSIINKQHSVQKFSKPLLSSQFLLNYFIYM